MKQHAIKHLRGRLSHAWIQMQMNQLQNVKRGKLADQLFEWNYESHALLTESTCSLTISIYGCMPEQSW